MSKDSEFCHFSPKKLDNFLKNKKINISVNTISRSTCFPGLMRFLAQNMDFWQTS